MRKKRRKKKKKRRKEEKRKRKGKSSRKKKRKVIYPFVSDKRITAMTNQASLFRIGFAMGETQNMINGINNTRSIIKAAVLLNFLVSIKETD